MIDVHELVSDPDFTSPCVLIRQKALRLPTGRDQITRERKEIRAVLQPLNDIQLMKIAETTSGPVTSGLTYFGTERLSIADDGYISDQIEFNGVLYDVISVADFSPNGAYYRATLIRSATL